VTLHALPRALQRVHRDGFENKPQVLHKELP
jgi:hypothetical protein